MSYSRLSDRRRVPWPRSWHLVAGGAIIAVLLQLWGLYRVIGPTRVPWFPYTDKAAHVICFALPVMLILLAAALRHPLGAQSPNLRINALVVAVFAVHGVVSELIQHAWYSYRTGDPLDVIADWIGIAAGVALVRLFVLRGSGRAYRRLAAP
jgi:VanZ family protein